MPQRRLARSHVLYVGVVSLPMRSDLIEVLSVQFLRMGFDSPSTVINPTEVFSGHVALVFRALTTPILEAPYRRLFSARYDDVDMIPGKCAFWEHDRVHLTALEKLMEKEFGYWRRFQRCGSGRCPFLSQTELVTDLERRTGLGVQPLARNTLGWGRALW